MIRTGHVTPRPSRRRGGREGGREWVSIILVHQGVDKAHRARHTQAYRRRGGREGGREGGKERVSIVCKYMLPLFCHQISSVLSFFSSSHHLPNPQIRSLFSFSLPPSLPPFLPLSPNLPPLGLRRTKLLRPSSIRDREIGYLVTYTTRREEGREGGREGG